MNTLKIKLIRELGYYHCYYEKPSKFKILKDFLNEYYNFESKYKPNIIDIQIFKNKWKGTLTGNYIVNIIFYNYSTIPHANFIILFPY